MGNRDPHKGNGTGKSSHTGRKHTGEQDKCYPEHFDIYTHALCISLSQLISTDGLGHQKGNHCRNSYNNGCNLYIAPAHTRKTSLGPAVQIGNIRILGKCNNKICHGRTDIADHNSCDQKRCHMMDPSGNQKNKSCGNQRSHKGRQYQRIRRNFLKALQKTDHNHSYHHLRPRGDSQFIWSCNGIVKKGLQKKPG